MARLKVQETTHYNELPCISQACIFHINKTDLSTFTEVDNFRKAVQKLNYFLSVC